VGGDFFDIINSEDSLSVVVADVSGKGISAAILACTLQGMIYSQLIANQPLSSIAAVVNRYICSKKIGKYATMTILRMGADGSVDYINCGHVPPFLHSASGCSRLAESNLPVGLIAEASFESAAIRVAPGSRILIVTDGVTEAEDGAGEFFGEERVAGSIAERISFDGIYDSIGVFCGPVPLNDDCTMLEIAYTG
jgi:sigma-B regulation protein RsbU (phosphoserine phosphatase)